MFKLKHSDNQKAYGFGCLADDTTDTDELVALPQRWAISEYKEYPF